MPSDCSLVISAFAGSVFTLSEVNIESYSSEPWMAEDNSTAAGVRLSISGTAIYNGENWTAIQAVLGNKSTRLTSALLSNTSIPAGQLINLSYLDSSIGGPYLKLTATQVIGAAVALIRWEITDTITACDTPIASNVWTQRTSVEATGRLTRTIQGTLRVNRGSKSVSIAVAARDNSNWDNSIPWADLFRRAILPDVPKAGWRRESQEFAYDVNGTGLMYQIVDRQYVHDLPDGCRVGDMEFTYERTAQDAGIGNCRLTIELEGDMRLMNTNEGNRILVRAAVALSLARINANYKNVIITRMAVTEKNIMSGFSIRFELEAQTFPTSTSGTTMAPIAFMVGQRFTVTRSNVDKRTMDAYGPPVNSTQQADVTTIPVGYWAAIPHYISGVTSGMNCANGNYPLPYAAIYDFEGARVVGTITVAVIYDTEGVSGMNSGLANGPHFSEMSQPAGEAGETSIVAHSVSTTRARYDSGFVKLSPMYLTGAELVLQTRRPKVLITERCEVSRANQAPPKVVRPLPDKAILVSDDWNVAFGRFDSQGTRLYTGIYERTFEMYDPAEEGAGYDTTSYDAIGSIRTWEAPSLVVNPAIAPIATDASQSHDESVFHILATAANNYSVPAQVFAT